jgi:predicted metalloprotease with PDZ domain
LRAAENGRDPGGKAGRKRDDDATARVSIGATLAANAGAILQHVFHGGPAERAGLSAGDTIVAIDGLRMSADAVERLLLRRRAGESVAVHAFRRDELITTSLTLAEAPHDTCWLSLDAKVDEDVRARRAAWLGLDS